MGVYKQHKYNLLNNNSELKNSKSSSTISRSRVNSINRRPGNVHFPSNSARRFDTNKNKFKTLFDGKKKYNFSKVDLTKNIFLENKRKYLKKKKLEKRRKILLIKNLVKSSFSTENFFIQNLETAGVYLGYSRRFRHPNMCFTLFGSKSGIDIHSLSSSRYNLSLALSIMRNVVFNFGVTWILAPKSLSLLNIFRVENVFSIFLTKNRLVLWTEKWISGSLTNEAILKLLLKKYRFPNVIFHPAFSSSNQAHADVKGAGVLQLGVLDSSAFKNAYEYWVPGNEKTELANKFFVKLVIKSIIFQTLISKMRFLRKGSKW